MSLPTWAILALCIAGALLFRAVPNLMPLNLTRDLGNDKQK